MRHSAIFVLLKAANTALATAWTFALTYSLVRVVGIEEYAVFTVVLAVAALVLQADLGLSVRLFARLRSDFIGRGGTTNAATRSAAAASFCIYLSLATLAAGVFAVATWRLGIGVAGSRPALVLFFTAAVLVLPITILKAALNAHDAFLLAEQVDFARRLLQLLLAVSLQLGVPLGTYAVANLVVILLALGALLAAVQMAGVLAGTQLGAGLRDLRADVGAIRASARLALCEFLIYAFPYGYLMLAFGSPATVVAFDMFFKVTRFGITAYMAGVEAMLPAQTRLYHGAAAVGLRRLVGITLLLLSVPFLAAIAAVGLYGDEIFSRLLDTAGLVSPWMRLHICIMLAFMLVQTASGGLLAALGFQLPLANRASATLGAMLLLSAGIWMVGGTFEAFISGYVLIYGCEAVSYAVLLRQVLRDRTRKGLPNLRGAS
ncbi:hypothetical protein JMJ56_24065 [Belnapia sp. T18]|uniref:Membrane protein involved in the export of O-antigen and teichoic acid n=1 Tax=Belnapia arida TaxID=2804533 RepID=A0ABS1U8S9_9PROT|nr:hypothetical protein [Belnapia arida]MBL6081087.1 hypothetical protein [Belnapia arida]